MRSDKLPNTDSIDELARFWDSHDVTEFEDQLEEVPEPVFELRPSAALRLEPDEIQAVEAIARDRGVARAELLREWILEKLSQAKAHS